MTTPLVQRRTGLSHLPGWASAGEENPDWGAPKIHGESQKLGFVVSERSGARYLSSFELLIIDELGFVPLSKIGAELLFASRLDAT
jgi:hypothetical protein